MKIFLKISFAASVFWFVVGAVSVSANYGSVLAQTQTPKQSSAQSEPTKKPEAKPSPAPKKTSPSPQTKPNNANSESTPPTQGQQSNGETTEPKNNSKGITDNSSGGWLDGIWTLLSWLALGFGGLLALGAAGWFIYYVLTSIGRERELNKNGFGAVRSKHNDFQRQIEQLNETARLMNERLGRQESVIQSLQRQLKEGGIVSRQQQQAFYETPVYKPESQFPVAAEDYLNKVRAGGQKASADLIGGLLVQDPNKGEEFLIVKDNTLTDGLFYAVPSIDRFSTKNEFFTYYQNYYACENPSSGMVWIKSPATVRRVDGGWQLQSKGELEIR